MVRGACWEIKYNGTTFTPDKLKTQIRHYEAVKEIVAKKNYDFIGVKCHYEIVEITVLNVLVLLFVMIHMIGMEKGLLLCL